MKSLPMSILIILVFLALTSCSSDDASTVAPASETYTTGHFIDSAVKGLTYTTDSTSGTTDVDGAYRCKNSERVYFKLGAATIGSAICNAKMTPYELMEESPLSSTKSKRVVKLLLSIDGDSDPSNGIDVSAVTSSITSEGSIDFSSDTAYQNILTDLSKADVGDAVAATHMQTYMDKTHTIFDGTYTGTMTVTSGSCGAYDLTIKIENAYLSIVRLDASGSSYATIFNYDSNYRKLTGTSGDTILQDIDWGTTDDTYCDDKSGVNKEIVRLNSLKVKHNGTDYYIDGIVTDKTICNNAAWTDHCAFTVTLNK